MFKNAELFESAPVPKAVLKLALPTILTMLVNVFYNMVDTFFIARTNDPNQVAAVSLATPVFLFLMAAGNIFGIGGSAYLSRSLGEKKHERVARISAFCCYGGIVIGLVIGAIFLLFTEPLLTLCGASPNTLGFASDYLRWIAYGAPMVVFGVAFSNMVRGEGAAKTAMFGQTLGMVVNMVLDPIMILGMKLGVAGAAIATVIGNIITCVFYIVYILTSKRTMLSLNPAKVSLGDGIFSNVFAIGTPASLNNVLMSFSNIMMNNFLAGYGDVYVASMGIAGKANMFIVFIMLGLAFGVQPLVGYSFGAKNYRRMNEVVRFTSMGNLVIGSVLTVVYFFFSAQIVGVFMDDPETVQYSILMVRALQLSMPVLGILFVLNNTFQAMGKALPSLILSVSRQGLVFVPLLFITRAIAGLNGIIYCQAIADIFSVTMALIMFQFMKKELVTPAATEK